MNTETISRQPNQTAGAALAGGVAPEAEAQSWPRLSALGSRLSALGSRLSALGSRLRIADSKRSLDVKPFVEQSITFPPSAPLRPGNRARKATAPVVRNVVPPPISEGELYQDFLFDRPGTDRVAVPRPRCNGFCTTATFDTPFVAALAVECCPIAPFRRPHRAFWQHLSHADPRQHAYAGLSGPSALASRHR